MTLMALWHEFLLLVRDALLLRLDVIQAVANSANGAVIALLVLLLAGFSQAVGQSVVLFINRVRPLRFVLSLGAASVLFVFSYLFWVLSLWLVSELVFRADFGFGAIAQGLALCYAPQMLGFLVALPYFGVPISVLLSLWTFLAILLGLEMTASLNLWEALACSSLGWGMLQVLQRTVGKPLAMLSRQLRNTLAGTSLVTNPQALEELVMAGNPMPTRPVIADWMDEAVEEFQLNPRQWLLQFAGLAFGIFLLIGLVGRPTGPLDWGVVALARTVRLLLQLVLICLAALLFSTLLTPLEALSWWAGWREAEVLNPGLPVRSLPRDSPITRYIAYLDGISQGSHLYMLPVERFLTCLAEALPDTMLVVKGIIPYSVANQPLSQQPRIGILWRVLESIRSRNPAIPIGFIINLRNLMAVAMSTDARYGPIQNQGLSQVLYDSLLFHGYEPGGGIPLTLIGSSGGGQMAMGAVPFLKRALNAPIQVISISGVISGNTGAMEVEHLYHLVGDRDGVARLGGLMFPARWPVAILSDWNRARRRGRISAYSLGPVKHNGLKGPYGVNAYLPDGRSHLQQTVDIVAGIILQRWPLPSAYRVAHRQSNYERYRASLYGQVEALPARLSPHKTLYSSQAEWMGRLILPAVDQRQPGQVKLEVYYAPEPYSRLIGQVVDLGWSPSPAVEHYRRRATYDVEFADQVRLGKRQGNLYPERLNHRQQVDPLESLAGAHPVDDITVLLPSAQIHFQEKSPRLTIQRDPVYATGRYYALVQFCEALGCDRFRVRHFNRRSGHFDGPEDRLLLPEVVADRDGIRPFSNDYIERSPLNADGWYVFGAETPLREFLVQAIAPRRLLCLQPDRVITGQRACLRYINHGYWKAILAQPGRVWTVLLQPQGEMRGRGDAGTRRGGDAETRGRGDAGTSGSARGGEGERGRGGEGGNGGEREHRASQACTLHPLPFTPPSSSLPPFPSLQPKDRLLVMHLFGGIGGKHPEFAPLGIYCGHFSFGRAQVIREPLTGDLRFDIEYRQLCTNNPNGAVSGSNHWSRYMGDRQFGWIGCRPVCDLLVQFPPLTVDYEFDGRVFSPLGQLMAELDVMAARYRVGDGAGITYRNLINSCVQDSAQALHNALWPIIQEWRTTPHILCWLETHPTHPQTARFWRLADLVESLWFNLEPFGYVRSDWKCEELTLGSFAEETPARTLLKTLASWRSVLPRLANDLIAMIFLQLGAQLWVMGSNQVGGENRDITAIAPTDFNFRVPTIRRASRDLTQWRIQGEKH